MLIILKRETRRATTKKKGVVWLLCWLADASYCRTLLLAIFVRQHYDNMCTCITIERRVKTKKPKEMTKKSQIDTRVQSGLLPNKPNALGRCRRCLIPHERDNLFGFVFFVWGRTSACILLERSGRPCLAANSWGFSCFFYWPFNSWRRCYFWLGFFFSPTCVTVCVCVSDWSSHGNK